MTKKFTMATLAAMFATAAFAGDDDFDLSMLKIEPPTLAIETSLSSDGGYKITSLIVVRNVGTTLSPRITLRCDLRDADENTIGMLGGQIGRIKPGKSGLNDAIAFSVPKKPTSVECELELTKYPL